MIFSLDKYQLEFSRRPDLPSGTSLGVAGAEHNNEKKSDILGSLPWDDSTKALLLAHINVAGEESIWKPRMSIFLLAAVCTNGFILKKNVILFLLKIPFKNK